MASAADSFDFPAHEHALGGNPPPGSAGGALGRITINFRSAKPAEDPMTRVANQKMLKTAEEHANKMASVDAILK
eukprot:CAMPEP_0198563936 /NCGR_PEP_ID=MMETSP1462-20131121/99509_1 /TAXON_ID=1333877 /ORGANISM="Brandtodinium nutriculum, Strain RCC3387" /LENGTH=74 /DNA_ID=CAMNT_0044294899 /DNA_START=1 /DNA_END=222 /DNA_ORIENTATION=+